MADQGRWFKLWCSAPSDDSLQQLSPAHRWAWAVLGCHIKVHGERGTVRISILNAALAGQMGVTVDDLESVIESFPNVRLEKHENSHGEIIVTWNKWVKYQEDTTQADRQRSSRSKKRREERRGEESKTLPPIPPQEVHPPEPKPKRRTRANTNGYTPGFEALWDVTPQACRVGKGTAFEVWQAYGLEPDATRIRDAMLTTEEKDLWRRNGEGQRCYPNLRTWLHQRRYDDLTGARPMSPEQRRLMDTLKGTH